MDQMTIQCCVAALEGCVGVVAGNFLYGKTKNGKDLTNFQRVLFSTGFAYILLVITELIRFFADYSVPGASLLHADLRPSDGMLFYRIFGRGNAGEGQFPLLATDLRYFYLMLGAFAAGVVLLGFYERKSKRTGDGNALFAEYHLEKQGLKAYLQSVVQAFRAEIPVCEYLLWWVLRGLMLWGLVRQYREDPSSFTIVLLSVNTAATFVVPLVRVFGFCKLFFGKMPLRVQTYIDALVFVGSFLGHALGWNSSIDEYDKMLHLATGGMCVLIGYTLIRSTRRGEKLSAGVCSAASFGFSCLVSIVWEIFEFFADYFIPDCCNQNWYFDPPADHVFFRIFGLGVGNPGLSVVLDTYIDILSHFCICLLTTAILYAVLKRRDAGTARKRR